MIELLLDLKSFKKTFYLSNILWGNISLYAHYSDTFVQWDDNMLGLRKNKNIVYSSYKELIQIKEVYFFSQFTIKKQLYFLKLKLFFQ